MKTEVVLKFIKVLKNTENGRFNENRSCIEMQ